MVSLLLPVIYLAFISLGLPDALLGAAWPSMYLGLGAGLSWAGMISMIISAGTVVSSLASDALTARLGPGRVTAISVGTTAAALFGFSTCTAFWQLCLWAVPYGLGAGSVDAALNNYVALHYESRHMSWLHCMWGLGASGGPVIMGWALAHSGWQSGYRIISVLQVVLTAIIIFSLPLWKKPGEETGEEITREHRTLPQLMRVPGVPEVMAMFACYSVVETTAGMWASSYCTLQRGIDAGTAASWASLFYVGITVGRFLSGFIYETQRPPDDQHGFCAGGAGHLAHSAAAGQRCAGDWAGDGGPGLCAYLSQRYPRNSVEFRPQLKHGPDRRADGRRLCGQCGVPAAVRAAGAVYQHQPVPMVSAGRADADGRYVPRLAPQDCRQTCRQRILRNFDFLPEEMPDFAFPPAFFRLHLCLHLL